MHHYPNNYSSFNPPESPVSLTTTIELLPSSPTPSLVSTKQAMKTQGIYELIRNYPNALIRYLVVDKRGRAFFTTSENNIVWTEDDQGIYGHSFQWRRFPDGTSLNIVFTS